MVWDKAGDSKLMGPRPHPPVPAHIFQNWPTSEPEEPERTAENQGSERGGGSPKATQLAEARWKQARTPGLWFISLTAHSVVLGRQATIIGLRMNGEPWAKQGQRCDSKDISDLS